MPLASPEQAVECALLMSNMDPWVTLQRPFVVCLAGVNDPTKEVHVVAEGGRVVAFIILEMHGLLRGYIQTVCVAPTHQRRGLGSRLIRWAEQRIASESPNVFLCVSSFNTEARELYERLGYVQVGTLKDYLVLGYDELLMRKSSGPWTSFRAR